MAADPVVRDVLADALPGSEATAVETVARGNSKRTALVALADGRDVVVQYRPLDRGDLATEAALTRAVGDRTDVPVPAVLERGSVDEYAYLVTARVPGVSLHECFEVLSPARRETLARTLGRHLAAVHDAFSFAGYGDVASRDGTLLTPAPTTDWRAWFREYVETGIARFDVPFADLADPIRGVVDRHADELPPAPTPRLFPWDFRPGNVVVTGSDASVAAVLDWGDPLAAAPALSLAKTTFLVADWYAAGETVDRLREAVRAGYRERRPLPATGDRVRSLYRLAAIVASAVDSRGRVTRPRYPMVDESEAVAFHRERLTALLARLDDD